MFNVIFYNISNTETSPQIDFSRTNLKSLKSGSNMFENCSTLESFSSDLSNLTNGEHMFYCCSALTTFSPDLPSLKNGYYMFASCSVLTSFNGDLSSLTDGASMFSSCSKLETFYTNLSSLSNGQSMFVGCTNLTSFSCSDLSNLTNGYSMFNNCPKLTSFNSDLPSLTNGYRMFYKSSLESFNSNLYSLTYGDSMFTLCEKLTSFSYDLSSLINGSYMFNRCSNLKSFSSDLSSLTYGYWMFRGCSLDAESVMYIADSIKNIIAEKQLYRNGTIPYVTLSNGVYSAPRGFMSNGNYVYTYNKPQPYTTTIYTSNVGSLTLGINVTNDFYTIKQQLEDFAKAATFDSWAELKQAFVDKGWTVGFQYGGTSDSIAYGLRDGEQIIPCQIFAKLVQVEDKDSAEYCTEDAASFYNIDWGHDVTDTSSYTQFNSLEDAMASWNVFPKENIISTEEED